MFQVRRRHSKLPAVIAVVRLNTGSRRPPQPMGLVKTGLRSCTGIMGLLLASRISCNGNSRKKVSISSNTVMREFYGWMVWLVSQHQ